MNSFPINGLFSGNDTYTFSNRTASELKLELQRSQNSKRYLVALLVCMGQINIQLLRSSLQIAVVEMTSNKTITMGNETIIQKPEFDWDSKTKGMVLSLFFYGFLTSPIGGGIAHKYGGGLMYGLGIISTAILTLLTPLCLRKSFKIFAFIQIFKGISQGISVASVVDIYRKWAREEERSKFVSIGFMGTYIGISVTLPYCGYLAHRYDWTMVFYGTGMIGLFWTLMWFLVVTNDTPEDYVHPEKGSQNRWEKKINPWIKIHTSKAFWALNVSSTAYALGYVFVVLCFPFYLKDLTNANTHIIGVLSGIPNFISIFIVPVIGVISDYVINKKILITTRLHKLYMCTSLGIAGLILILITLTSNIFLIMILFVFFKVLLGFSSFVINILPIAMTPKYSSLVTGLSTFWYTLVVIIFPNYIGFIVTDHYSYQWEICFYSGSAIMFIAALVFFFWASSDIQPWAMLNDQENESDIEMSQIKSP